jgi:uncharacterized membrane protein
MEKLTKPGRIIFAIGIIALGILCFISKDFIVGRPPVWPDGWAINPVLAYVSGAVLIIAAIAMLITNEAGLASLLIAILIFLLSVLRHIPHFMNDWANAYKSMALFGGALIVSASFFKEDSNSITGSRFGGMQKNFLAVGIILLAVFFIACGYAHFKFAEFVKDFIPAYIPFHNFWTYFCGICLFAGGVGLLIPQTRRWAALLSGLMIAGWFILLHIPRFITNLNDVSDRMGLCESFTFTGICFVLAGMSPGKKQYVNTRFNKMFFK